MQLSYMVALKSNKDGAQTMKGILAALVLVVVFLVGSAKAQTIDVSISTDSYDFELLISDIDMTTENLLNEKLKEAVLKKFEKRVSKNQFGLVKSGWFIAAIHEMIEFVNQTSIATGTNPAIILSALEERYKKEVASAQTVALVCKNSLMEKKGNDYLVTQETALILVRWVKLEYELSIIPPAKKSPVKIYWEDETNSA